MKTILETVIGSRAYGLETPESDWDRRSVFVYPTRDFWKLNSPPDVIEYPDSVVAFELRKFLKLASDGNPNVLEYLFSEYATSKSEEGGLLLVERERFLSKKMVAKYVGFAQGVFSKDSSSKDHMHAFRLLYTCIRALRSLTLDIRVAGYGKFLMDVRNGQLSTRDLQAEFQRALAEVRRQEGLSSLAPEPDYAWIEVFLSHCRRVNL